MVYHHDFVFLSEIRVGENLSQFFWRFNHKIANPIVSIREVSCDKVCSYGIVDGNKIDENIYKITQLIEKPKSNQISSNLAILGRYILTDDIFDKIK